MSRMELGYRSDDSPIKYHKAKTLNFNQTSINYNVKKEITEVDSHGSQRCQKIVETRMNAHANINNL